MTEAAEIGVEQERQSDLFLVNDAVHHDITSLFLRANDNVRQQLVGTVGITKDVVSEHEQRHGGHTFAGHVRSAVVFNAGSKIRETYPELYKDYFFMWFREELTAYSSEELALIESEFGGILNGDIILTEAEKQQLSNLSDADMCQYLSSLGLKAADLAFPLLDVGTGQHAYFAQDVLQAFPEQRVVSTSMHLMNPKSIMSRVLAGETDRGELVPAEGTSLPFEDDSFGMVVSLNADPYYVPKKDLLLSLREKQRVLRVGATALLCPAVCEYGQYDITEEDLVPLQGEVDVALCPIPESGKLYYRGDTKTMLVIKK